MKALERSTALHRRVRAFAQRGLGKTLHPRGVGDDFESLACEIAAFQTGVEVRSLEQVIARGVPTDNFRLGRVFAFEPSLAELRFVTSGTTGQQTGTHYMRERATYEFLSLEWGKRGLGFVEGERPPVVLALAPWTGWATSSSLGYMMQRMMERFDGCSLSVGRERRSFQLDVAERWLVRDGAVDTDALRRMAELASKSGARLVLLSTSFALVELIDALDGETLELPPGSLIMPTGGFKGRTRTIEPDRMLEQLRRTFGDVDIVGEYGMTELTSQLYEGTARCGELQGTAGVYVPPPWLRVYPLDPVSLRPAEPGAVGLAAFVDLGNVDSAVCVLTQDLVVAEGPGVRLLGRRPNAPVRGCSLAIEAVLRGVAEVQRKRVSPPRVTPSAHDVEHTDALLRSGLAPEARILDLIRAARDLQDELLSPVRGGDRLRALADSSGLSVEGARLALAECLETQPTNHELACLMACVRGHYGSAGTSWVLMSSNVFTAPLRAVCIALAAGTTVKVRPSRREPLFTQWLHERSPSHFDVVERLAPEHGDLVLAFGTDETLAEVERTMPEGVRFFGHGHGMGVAFVGPGAAGLEAAQQLAKDVVLFDQQGCLSPRLAIVDARNDTERFTRDLSQALGDWEPRAPRGEANAQHEHERAWSRRVAEIAGEVTPAGEGWIARFSEEWATQNNVPIPVASRSLSLVVASDPRAHGAGLATLVTSVGVAGEPSFRQAVADEFPRARITKLGSMQKPPLDGPVDLRAVALTRPFARV